MDLDRIGACSKPARRCWEPRDCALYALALGASWDELEYVSEVAAGADQRVFPTFVLAGVMAAESASWPDPGFATGDYAPQEIVHGEQALELHAAIEPRGDVQTTTSVADILDKGSGALVVLETRASRTSDGSPVFTATTSLFVRGHGGFGRKSPTTSGASGRLPDRPPDRRFDTPTLPIQSLLYRHAGHDANAIHVDPAVARAAGFEGPILTGLNSLGIACRALLRSSPERPPEALRRLSGRFASPGYNGDLLTTEIWEESGGELRFRVVSQRGSVLIDAGHARFSP